MIFQGMDNVDPLDAEFFDYEISMPWPEIDNNIGYTMGQLNKYDEAIKRFDSAITASPRLQAAYFNRAMIRFKNTPKKAQSVPDFRAVADIQKALQIGPGSAELHMGAARIFAACSRKEPALADAAIEQLDLAVQNGQNPATLRADVNLTSVLDKKPRFLEIAGRPATPESIPSKQLKLLEPKRP